MNSQRQALLITLFLLALAASVVHLGAHPVIVPDKADPGATVFRGSFVAASVLPLLDLVLVTLLFSTRRTAALGFLLNGVIVIYGTVLMGHFGIVALAAMPEALATGPPTLADYIFKSMSLDIGIAWADFFAGRALYESWLREA